MKKIFIMAVLSLISQASFALPGDGQNVVKCHRHGELKGSFITSESNFQLACFNQFKSPEDLASERREHPQMKIATIDDTDPSCYTGKSASGSSGPGL
jgi:hypothetical protein